MRARRTLRLLLQVGPKTATGAVTMTPTRRLSGRVLPYRWCGRRAKRRSVSMVNSDNVILDDIWAWRADHGNGVGWTVQHGRHRRHRQRRQRDRLRPVRRALPEDRGDLERQRRHGHLLPERDALRPAEPGGMDGGSRRRRLAGLQGCQHVTSFSGYGMGSYSFFNQGVNIYADACV